jgi:DNA polymerase III subunit epsilon
MGVPQDGIIAQEIAAAGGKVMAGIGKSTTLVVVENLPITPGMMSSASWRKIEELRAKGQRITIAAWHELKERSKN